MDILLENNHLLPDLQRFSFKVIVQRNMEIDLDRNHWLLNGYNDTKITIKI